MRQIDYKEFDSIIAEYINHPKYQEMKKYVHHGSTRYNHSYKVALNTYKVIKRLGLDYESATRGAILHDFFLDEVQNENGIARIRRHPSYSVMNSKKYFDITEKEEDIIKTHMFPVTFTPPKYIEGWIVDIIDDVVSIQERSYIAKKAYMHLRNTIAILVIMFLK